MSAEGITDQVATALLNKKHRTETEQHSLDKYFCLRDTGLSELTESDVEWYTDKGKSAIRNIRAGLIPEALLKYRDYDEVNLSGVYSSDQRKWAATVALRNSLLPQRLLDGSPVSNRWLHDSGWVKNAVENATTIKSLLGIKVSSTQPMLTLKSILGQVGLEVIADKRYECVQVESSYIGNKTKTPGRNQTRDRLYVLAISTQARMTEIVKRNSVRWNEENILEAATAVYKLRKLTPTAEVAHLISALEAVAPVLTQEQLDNEPF